MAKRENGSSFGLTAVTADVSWGSTQEWPPPSPDKNQNHNPRAHPHTHTLTQLRDFFPLSFSASRLLRQETSVSTPPPLGPSLFLSLPRSHSLYPIAFVFLLYSPPSLLYPVLSPSHLLLVSCMVKLFKCCCKIGTFIFTISRYVNSFCCRICKLNISPSNCCIKATIIAHNIM